MVWFIAGVYVAAGAAAVLALLAASVGPWGVATLTTATLLLVWGVVELATRAGRRFASPNIEETEEERTAFANLHRRDAGRSSTIIWS